jgi:hypothetical protein
VRVWRKEVQTIVEDEEKSDDDALRDFNAVYASQHVDALRAEHSNARHVNIVEKPEINELAEIRLKLKRQDDRSDVEVYKVNDKKRDGSQAGNPPLVSPANIEEIITNTEKCNCLKGDDGTQE